MAWCGARPTAALRWATGWWGWLPERSAGRRWPRRRPTVTALRDVTGESAQLWLPDGEWRVCLLSVEATHELRTIVDEGSRVAIDVGSGGRALQGEAGTAGWVATVGERADGVGSVSAGVLGPSGSVVAAVGISGPIDRLGDDPGARFGGDVVAAANELSEALGVPPRHG